MLLEKTEQINDKIKLLEIEMTKEEVYSVAEKINKVIDEKTKLTQEIEKNEELWLLNEEELQELLNE
jgi:ATP-binding cassette subfamily F protein 3